MKKKNWITSPWTISIAMVLLSFFLTMLKDILDQVPVLSTLEISLVWIWNAIISILTFEIQLWLILVGLGLLIGILYILDKLSTSKTPEPDFLNYREGNLIKWRWTWGWEWNKHKNVWVVSNLNAHCPECGTPMIDRSGIMGLFFDCPRGDFSTDKYINKAEDPLKIERIILDNLDRRKANQ